MLRIRWRKRARYSFLKTDCTGHFTVEELLLSTKWRTFLTDASRARVGFLILSQQTAKYEQFCERYLPFETPGRILTVFIVILVGKWQIQFRLGQFHAPHECMSRLSVHKIVQAWPHATNCFWSPLMCQTAPQRWGTSWHKKAETGSWEAVADVCFQLIGTSGMFCWISLHICKWKYLSEWMGFVSRRPRKLIPAAGNETFTLVLSLDHSVSSEDSWKSQTPLPWHNHFLSLFFDDKSPKTLQVKTSSNYECADQSSSTFILFSFLFRQLLLPFKQNIPTFEEWPWYLCSSTQASHLHSVMLLKLCTSDFYWRGFDSAGHLTFGWLETCWFWSNLLCLWREVPPPPPPNHTHAQTQNQAKSQNDKFLPRHDLTLIFFWLIWGWAMMTPPPQGSKEQGQPARQTHICADSARWGHLGKARAQN